MFVNKGTDFWVSFVLSQATYVVGMCVQGKAYFTSIYALCV